MTSHQEPEPAHEELGTRLRTGRPVPRAPFRGELRRRLVALAETERTPRRLRLLITAYASAGTALMAAAAVGVAGVGPFGA